MTESIDAINNNVIVFDVINQRNRAITGLALALWSDRKLQTLGTRGNSLVQEPVSKIPDISRRTSLYEVLEIMHSGESQEDTNMFLLNSFSLNMLTRPAKPLIEDISLEEAKKLLQDGFTSAVGHTDTANILADLIQIPVEPARITVSLEKGEVALIGQYIGPRLPEGTTTLPAGSTIQWIKVTV